MSIWQKMWIGLNTSLCIRTDSDRIDASQIELTRTETDPIESNGTESNRIGPKHIESNQMGARGPRIALKKIWRLNSNRLTLPSTMGTVQWTKNSYNDKCHKSEYPCASLLFTYLGRWPYRKTIFLVVGVLRFGLRQSTLRAETASTFSAFS